jgi:hypothetical protein
MMTKTIGATCLLPEGETIWDEDEIEVLQPGGRAGTDAVAELVRSVGFETDPVEADLEHHGWQFSARRGDVMIHVTVFHLEDEFYVTMGELRGCLSFGGSSSAFGELAERLFEAMSRDERFSNVSWERE